MLDVRKGLSAKPAASEKLIEYLKSFKDVEGLLYIGYPILYVAGESLTLDALWVSKKYGIVVFDIIEGTNFDDRSEYQDELFGKVNSLLVQYPKLNVKRTLAVNIDVITFAPGVTGECECEFRFANNKKKLFREIEGLKKWRNDELYEMVISVVQTVIRLKVSDKREYIKKENSRGARIKKLEDTISTLDREQESAIIESFNGVERLRGLAGSGKTIVLALKAAYLHAQFPDWDIAVTFNTRALKNQFKELIERFCVEKRGELPNWEKVKILQAWGSPRNEGIYYNFCKRHNIEYLDFNGARRYSFTNKAENKTLLDEICNKALGETKRVIKEYDAILVDEAQDLSESFLKLCFQVLKAPKRLVYAYDELQKLNEGTPLGNPQAIFGVEAKDTILHKCYRNSRPLLVTAHALGFGVYRKEGLVQFFDHPQLWKDVGYTTKAGELSPGSKVELCRTNETSPEYLEKHSELDDILLFKRFEDIDDQARWVADEIEKNLKKDELLYKDIVVINPEATSTKKQVTKIRKILLEKNINNHIAGEFDADIFYEKNSITFTGIHRAKGNEAPMVYIINANDCCSGGYSGNLDLIKKRNTLFTAITRSKAWVRICGIGEDMDRLTEEYNKTKEVKFELHFTYPTKEQIKRMNIIHRDITEGEKVKLRKDVDALSNINEILDRVKSGESFIEDYPKDLQEIILKLL